MPYVEGESLRERLDRERQLPIEEAVHHARSIASALDYAHRQQIVHRDIKPENVMLYEGEAMVMDFGIAKAVSSAGADTLTQTGMMVGTPAYVSPEQAAGETNLDGRSDQYSLACVLYEMLSGERAFSGPTAQAVMAKRFTETAKPLRSLRGSIPEPVERAVTRAMSTDAAARYKTAAQFAQALASSSVSTPTDTQTLPQQTVSSAKSVAVLPFSNMSTDAENEYFADGMAEEIINALSKIQSLRVASRTVSFALKGKNEDLADVGSEAPRLHSSRRQRAENGKSRSHHGAARERRRRIPAVVRPLRPRDGGHLRDSGRHLAVDRESAARDTQRRRKESDREGAHRQRRGIRLLHSRPAVLSTSCAARASSTPGRCSTGRSRSIRSTPWPTPASPIAARCSTCISMRASSTCARQTWRAARRSSSSPSSRKRTLHAGSRFR